MCNVSASRFTCSIVNVFSTLPKITDIVNKSLKKKEMFNFRQINVSTLIKRMKNIEFPRFYERNLMIKHICTISVGEG